MALWSSQVLEHWVRKCGLHTVNSFCCLAFWNIWQWPHCVNTLNCCGFFQKHCEWHVWIQLKELWGLANQVRLSGVNWAYSHTMGHRVIILPLHFQTMLYAVAVCEAVLNTWACWCEPVLLFHWPSTSDVLNVTKNNIVFFMLKLEAFLNFKPITGISW